MNKSMYWALGALIIVIVGFAALQIYLHIDMKNFREGLKETRTAPKLAPYKRNVADTDNTNPTAEKTKTEGIESPPSEPHANLTEQTQEAENTEGVPVSPHGFGPFPEVPDDYFLQPFSWDFYKNDPPIYELMARVRVKLWKQGIRTTGIRSSSATGLVYPTIPGTVFVRKYYQDENEYLEIQGSPKMI